MKILVNLSDVPLDAIEESMKRDGLLCRESSPGPIGMFICTRGEGHDGPHVAAGLSAAYEAWEDAR